MELLQRLKRLSDELDLKLSRVSLAPKKGPPPETKEAQLLGELECLRGQKKVLLKEIGFLKPKLEVNADYSRIVEAERELAEKLKRNEEMRKQLANKNKNIEKRDSRYEKLQIEIDNAPPLLQKEQERLFRHIHKELERQQEMEKRLQQDEETTNVRNRKVDEIQQKIEDEETELERLREEASQAAVSVPESRGTEDFAYMDISELKNLFLELKGRFDAEMQLYKKEREKLESEIQMAKEKIGELRRVSYLDLIPPIGKEDKRAPTPRGLATGQGQQRQTAGKRHVAARPQRGRAPSADSSGAIGEDETVQQDQAEASRTCAGIGECEKTVDAHGDVAAGTKWHVGRRRAGAAESGIAGCV